MIGSIPQACVLSVGKAAASAVGRAAAVTFGERCTDEFALLMYMAMGRRDASHPFYPYLASLPEEDPDHASMCGRLLQHMYCTRGVADGWQEG